MSLNQFPRRAFSGAATLQTFTGNGSTTTFTLSQEQFQNESFVFVDDVAQVPGVDFGINGTSLTFTSAPANNAEIIVRGFGVPTPLNSVSDGAITTAKIAESAITHSKLHTTAIQDKLGYTPVSPTQLTTEINNLIAAAPGALNTLDELAAALGDDANFATTITNALATKANTSSLGTLATISPTGTPDSTKFLRGDNSWQVVAVTPTAVSNQANDATGYFQVAKGTTAERPASPTTGMLRYNTTLAAPEIYTAEGWVTFGVALGSAANPARNALQLKAQGYPSGQYYIAVDGYPSYRMYVDNDRNGGGWVMTANVKMANCQDHHNNGSVRFDGTNGPTPSTGSTTKVSDAWMNAYRAQSSYSGTTAYWMEATTTGKNNFISSAATVDVVSSASDQDARTYVALTYEGSLSNRDPNTGTRGFGDHHTGGADYFAYQRHPEQGGNCGFKSDSMGSSDGYLWIK